jgi:glutaredoxin
VNLFTIAQEQAVIYAVEAIRISAYAWAMVLIFGKDGCPYTQNARDHYAAGNIPFQYLNVKKNAADLQRMLEYSKGARRVPVIVEDERVTIGFGGT